MHSSQVSYLSLIRFIWQFMRPQRLAFFIIFFAAFAWSLDTLLWPLIFRIVIDIFTQFDTVREAAWSALKLPVLFGLCFWVITETGYRIQGFLLARAIPKLEADIRMAMFDHIQHHSPRYFNEKLAGSLANKITDMTTQVSSLLQELLSLVIPSVAACLFGILFFAFVNPFFALILGVWIVIHFIICIIFTRKCGRYEQIHSEVRSSLLGKIVDSLTNNFAVNLFYRFGYEKRHLKTLQKKEQDKNYQAKRCVEIMRFFLGTFTLLGAGVCINGLIIYLWLKGSISGGAAVQIFNTTWNINMLLWLTGTSLPNLFQSIGIAKQALSIMNDPQDLGDLHDSKPLQVSSGEIIFDQVSFQYGDKKLFQNKNVHIKRGEKVGLVGYSGAGKSTFVNLLLRLYPIKAGKILIDGQEISSISLESLRKQVALIPQEPLLFHRTLKENIHYGNLEATENEIFQAAKLAHCEEFIKKMPNGYHTLVGERGAKLSGGERQRIAIARAILTKAPILILDEATSALDSVTENYIQESLAALMQNRTTLVIAHRLSTLARMDRILVFDQGRIVEEGTHTALLALGGHYARMWQMQAGGFLPTNTPKLDQAQA